MKELSYRDFKGELLMATYKESQKCGDKCFTLGFLCDQHSLAFNSGWGAQALGEFIESKWIKGPPCVGPERELPIELTGQGLVHVEALIESKKSQTISSRIKKIPWGKGLWDLMKIALGFFLGYLFSPSVNGSTFESNSGLQSRIDAIVSDCGYTGMTTFKATGPNEVTMFLDMEAFKKNGPENETTATAHACVMEKLREIPNLSLGFSGNGQEK